MISMIRRATTILIILQMVIVFVLVSFFIKSQQTTYRYQLDEIEEALESKEFIVHNLKQENPVKRLKNNICLDSQGVYRQCDDDTYEKMIESDKKEKYIEKQASELEGMVADKEENTSKLINTKRKVTSVDEVDSDNSRSTLPYYQFWQHNKTWRESAPQQSSAMGNMTKIISSKVKNSNKRFISDKRILFSNVYEQVDSVEDVTLLVIVNSGALKRARRDSIRATWWTQCSQDSNVRCFFFTDDLNSPSLKRAKKELLREKQKYHDIVFQPIGTGLKFGYRILYQMQWSVAHYRFKYLLRVDDDALVCLQHLIHDLKYFPSTNLQWGYLHCDSFDVIYIDEGLTIFSRDLVLKFLSQNPLKMRCHMFGDQQIAIWINDLNFDAEEIYVHDSRIHHHPPASNMKEYFYELDDICQSYVIVHGVYPGDLEDFWEVSNRKKIYSEYQPSIFRDVCEKPATFYWYALGYPFRHRPKYCIKKPEWNEIPLLENGGFAGRESKYDPDSDFR